MRRRSEFEGLIESGRFIFPSKIPSFARKNSGKARKFDNCATTEI
jgi:hypothetical protein